MAHSASLGHCTVTRTAECTYGYISTWLFKELNIQALGAKYVWRCSNVDRGRKCLRYSATSDLVCGRTSHVSRIPCSESLGLFEQLNISFQEQLTPVLRSSVCYNFRQTSFGWTKTILNFFFFSNVMRQHASWLLLQHFEVLRDYMASSFRKVNAEKLKHFSFLPWTAGSSQLQMQHCKQVRAPCVIQSG